MPYLYKNIECNKMTEQDIINTSTLFSNNYGVWSINSNRNPGKHIKMSPDRIKRDFVNKPDRFVAMVFDDTKLIGHAFYMRRTVQKNKIITWILQLVVDKDYRRNKIGTKLLHSIFGLSDSFACGIFTSNPMTIKALEDATFRHVDVNMVNQKIETIKTAAYDIFDDTNWIDEYNDGIVNTKFFVDHSSIQENISRIYPNKSFRLPKNLNEGCEWLAFTFKSQKPLVDNNEQIRILTDYSDDMIKESYSYMNMKKHAWSHYSEKEVELISKNIGSNCCTILDFGCGQGRHSIALSSLGYDVIGVDFSKENIDIANSENNSNATFYVDDARTYKNKNRVDVCLAMYDVIGSFPDESENIKIIKNAYRNLKKEGIFIASVMNMELTSNRCKKFKNSIKDIDGNIDKLLKLPASNTMQNTGDVFDGRKILLDETSGICYRKEQFFSDNSLPKEYIVRDKRYTRKGIINMFHREGFSVEDIYCFNARDINIRLNSDDKKAKEILVIARKKNYIYKVFQRFFNSKNYQE